ncbi:MAG: response regulator [Thermodesulfobacteriota bacterium]|nr:response regulator [Thermodesulfobacteriota bacterium]
METILIVDDQACVRQYLSHELISEGYRVVTADNTESVADHMTVSHPDLILLDLFLDGPEGFARLDGIRAHEPNLPVIVFTAYDGLKDDPRLSWVDEYVIKSCDLQKLKEKIAHVLKKRPAILTCSQACGTWRYESGMAR